MITDTAPLEQTGSFGWVWLVAMLGVAVVTQVGNWIVAKVKQPPATVQLPTGETLDARNSQSLARMLADLYDQVGSLQDENRGLIRDRELLVVEASTLRKGIEDGTIPPLHAPDPRVYRLVNGIDE